MKQPRLFAILNDRNQILGIVEAGGVNIARRTWKEVCKTFGLEIKYKFTVQTLRSDVFSLDQKGPITKRLTASV